jgi:hypothetical protein
LGEPSDQVQHCRFAATGRTNDRDKLSIPDCEADGVEDAKYIRSRARKHLLDLVDDNLCLVVICGSGVRFHAGLDTS